MTINLNPVQQFTPEKEAREWVEEGAHEGHQALGGHIP